MENKLIIGTELNTKSFEKQIEKVEQRLKVIDTMLSKRKELYLSDESIKKYELEAEKLNNQLTGLYQKQAKINNQGFNNMKQSLDNVGNSITGVTKKVVKWGLAVFGVRSIYLGIRQAVSQIMQEDENLKWQIDYMKFAIGQAIKPVVKWIVDAVHQLLVWIGAIIKLLFGWNIFSNATQANFKKANTNAKQLKKTLSGFDEMNILNEDGSTGIANSIGNALSDFGDIAKQVDELAGKLKPFENDIKAIAILAAGIFGTATIAKWIGNIGNFLSSSKGAAGLGSTLTKLGIIAGGIIITGIIAKNVWDEAQQLKEEIDKINKAGQEGQKKWLDNEKDINTILNTQKVNRSAINGLLEKSNTWLYQIFGWDKKNLETAQLTAENIGEQIKKSIELYKEKVKENGETEETKQMQQDIKDSIVEQYKWNQMLIEKLKEAGIDTSKIETLNGNLIQNYKDIGGEVFEIKDDLGKINLIQFDDKVMDIKMKVDTSQAEKKTNSWLDNLWSGIKNAGTMMANTLTFGAFTKAKVASDAKKIFGAKGMIYNPPKLAAGGIINMPGRGVPLGSAYGGERGMEGVIPLTDSQQMALLGEAIGKYINVNLTNITELDGRQIARKVEQINQNNNFVLNR